MVVASQVRAQEGRPGRPAVFSDAALPHRHHRPEGHPDHPNPQDRARVERGLHGCAGPQ